MTDIAALRALHAAVKAGTCPDFCPMWHGEGHCMQAEAAFSGPLDAAHALHNAVLPGWGWHIEGELAAVWHPETHGVSRDFEEASTPASSWLLAILAALVAQEEGKAE